MKLFDATLDLARFVGTVFKSTATGGSTTSLVDTSMREANSFYDGGTIWILSGTNAGNYRKINKHVSKELFFDALGASITSGVRYAVADATFPLNLLKEAVNQSLVYFQIPRYDTSLTVDTSTNVYTLPAGVSNILRVEIACNDTEPYSYEHNYWWREIDGKLEIRDGVFLDDDGKKIRITYAVNHGEIDDSGDIDPNVHPEYIRYAGAVWLWRNYIQKTEMDSLIAKEMFNESKMLEMEARLKAKDFSHLPSRTTLLPDF